MCVFSIKVHCACTYNIKHTVFKCVVQVELGDKEWRKMKQQQQLVFGDAASDVINKQQAKRKSVELELSLQHNAFSENQGEPVVRDLHKESKQEVQEHHLPSFHKSKQSPQKETKEEHGRLRLIKVTSEVQEKLVVYSLGISKI